MRLTSAAFADGEQIPGKYTCGGDDVSPPLAWSDPPYGTASLALCVDDPDAGRHPLTHWLAWGIPPGTGALAEGEVPPAEDRSDFGAVGYRSPCPPPGSPHRYVLRLHALDAEPELSTADRRGSFDAALQDHVLATATLTRTYAR